MERNRNAHTYFNSRPHKEVDQSDVQKKLENQVFQLTISQGDRHQLLSETSRSAIISTHDLTKRSTPRTFLFRNLDSCFNSRPHEEVDMRFLSQLHIISVSTHDLTKRSTLTLLWREWFKMFQLTTSRRGRPFLKLLIQTCNCVSTHDLTKRSTASADGSKMQVRCFNSRPHEEVDDEYVKTQLRNTVSTHDLTKRSTNAHLLDQNQRYVSTHDLTKRSTPIQSIQPHSHICFNSRPHEEVDVGVDILSELQEVSTHDLTKRSTKLLLEYFP